MDDYPANSRAAKKNTQEPKKTPPEKKVEKVITGGVTRRKRSLGKRFTDVFGGADSRSVGEYIVMDVLVPGVKEIAHDIVTSYVQKMLFPEDRPGSVRRRSASAPTTSRTNYHGVSSSIRRDPREESRGGRHLSHGARSRHNFSEIILDSRVEAEEVLDRMIDRLREYDSVSVADLYDMLDVTSEFTDNKWGWYELDTARVRYVRGGYLLDLPKPIDFD